VTIDPGPCTLSDQTKSALSDWKDAMSNSARITEIDITRQARALGWLRLTDYALIVLCGGWAVGLLSGLVLGLRSESAGTLVFEFITSLILCFAVYTGWRHVGVIDPAVWKTQRILFPLLVVLCLFVAWGTLEATGSVTSIFEEDRSQAIQQLSGVLTAGWIAAVSLLGWISLMMLRRMKVTAMSAPLDRVLRQLIKSGGLNAAQAAHIKRINTPRGTLIGLAGAFILLVLILAPIPSNKALADVMLRSNQQLTLLGFFLLVRARRYFQINADSLLAVDHRPPILFLRSFDDDEKQQFGRSDRAFLDFSLETRLSNHFSRFGPFVAIGSPKETLPQLGAARVLLSDDEWQPRVLNWMRQSNVVIMYSGKTHWVNWELRQLLENGCVTRLILMIPEIKGWRRAKRNKDISARVEQIRDVFRSTPWEEELLQFEDFAGLRAMLFRPDGSMVMVKSRSHGRDSYHLAALVAHLILLNSAHQSVPQSSVVDMPMANALDSRSAVPVPVDQASPAHVFAYASAPPTARKVAPVSVPIPSRTRSIAFAIAATALASVLVCAIVGYAYIRHATPREAATSSEATPKTTSVLPAIDQPPPPDDKSVALNAANTPSTLVPADSIPVPPDTPRVRTKQEAPERHGQDRAMLAPQGNSAPQSSQVPQLAAERTAPVQPVTPDPTIAMVLNAQLAMSAGHLLEPMNDSALYWAQQLKQQGNLQGATMEKSVLDTIGRQIVDARETRNYNSAIDLVNKLMQFYPARSELVSLKAQLDREQQQQAAEIQVKQFIVQHRHVLFDNSGNMAQAYCVGVLLIAPDASARFDCTTTFDPQGRCDHVFLPTGSIKEVKFLKNGLLHVATHHSGNLDFYGDAANLQGAYQGLGPLARK
jgi:hypothetical protein